MEAGHGLTDGEFVKEFSTIDIFKNYRFREEPMRRATSVDFVTHTPSDLDDQSYRMNSTTYLRPINRIPKMSLMRREAIIGDRKIRMVVREGCRSSGDTKAEIDEMFRVGHFREEIDKINIGALSVLFGDEVGGFRYNQDCAKEESDNSNYQGDRSKGQVLLGGTRRQWHQK